jgi:signal transduction histidine kinase
VDGSLTVGLLTVSLLLGHQPPAAPWRALDGTGYLLAVLAVLPVLLRRTAPWSVLLASFAAWTALIALGFWPVVGVYGPLLAVYSTAACRGRPGAVAGVSLLAGIWIFAGLVTPGSDMRAVVSQAVVVPPAFGLFGLQACRLADRNRRLAQLTEQLHRERAAHAEHAVTTERLRIARELHDVVAHHLSVVSVQSGLASYVFDADPPTARAALTTITQTSAEALEEMRSMLQVLRLGQNPAHGSAVTGGSEASDGERVPGASVSRTAADAEQDGDGGQPLRPLPALVRLPELIERLGAAGMEIRFSVSGMQRPLPPGVELCAYRIIQEALTNTLKHAGPTGVDVALHYGPVLLVGRVIDDGPRSPAGPGAAWALARPTVPGSGNGLIGMHERVRIYGGTLRAEPRPQGGFEVVFTLPSAPTPAQH